MNDYVEVYATITDKWGGVESVWVGTQPKWAWQVDRCEDWRKMMRKLLLSERTSTPTGWRVVFDAVSEVEVNA
jgi:hypothetical protein